jgi:hypothetical protein
MEGEGKSVKRTTEVCATRHNLSRPFHGLVSCRSIPSIEMLGYFHGVRFTDAFAGYAG